MRTHYIGLFYIRFYFHLKCGTYNPIASQDGAKEVTLKVDRLKYWISVGAQPSDRVAWILGKFGVMPLAPQRYNPQRAVPKKDHTNN
mmetsp:Transcript_32672/g.75204  ORF Transcript_32672/g.75204 Transcript_32672/m.75204 type:complete len:87 (+) Transcript_32672:638-898(+)